jgi:hypothetical protein
MLRKWYRDSEPELVEASLANAEMLYGAPAVTGAPRFEQGKVGVYVTVPEDHPQAGQDNVKTAVRARSEAKSPDRAGGYEPS